MRNDVALEPDGVITVNDKILIPPSCRDSLLKHFQEGHIDRDTMKSLAQQYCFWPTINADIANFVHFFLSLIRIVDIQKCF